MSYNAKHNEANDEGNRDGIDDNRSWNCGVEGDSDDAAICALRRRQSKNALLALCVARGTPMLLMGDEMGRTQDGNNNAYCHDSEMNWLDWSLAEREAELLRFTRLAIALRHQHPVLRLPSHPRGDAPGALGFPEASWHGSLPWQPRLGIATGRRGFRGADDGRTGSRLFRLEQRPSGHHADLSAARRAASGPACCRGRAPVPPPAAASRCGLDQLQIQHQVLN